MFSFNFLFVLRFHTNHSTKEHRKIIVLKTYFSLPKINLITESLLRCKQLTAGEATAAGKLAVRWKTHNQKAREMRMHLKGASKKSATTRPTMVGVGGSAVQMQSRSCASCGDVLDFGVGNSSQHGSQMGLGHSSQPQFDADGMTAYGATNLKPVHKKAYQSPYSQRKR